MDYTRFMMQARIANDIQQDTYGSYSFKKEYLDESYTDNE